LKPLPAMAAVFLRLSDEHRQNQKTALSRGAARSFANIRMASCRTLRGQKNSSGTQYLIRSGKQRHLLTCKVLTGHRYREVIESLSKSKFGSFSEFS
jgi:hypothetical protein